MNTNKKASVHSTRTHRPKAKSKASTKMKSMNRFMPGRQDAEPPRNEEASLPRFDKKIETHRADGYLEVAVRKLVAKLSSQLRRKASHSKAARRVRQSRRQSRGAHELRGEIESHGE